MNAGTDNVAMMEFKDMILSKFVTHSLFMTLIVFLTILVIRLLIVRLIKGKSESLDKDQRRWINKINNGATSLFLIFMVFLWAPQLQTFALSMTALAMAFVWSTKELWMCITGGFLKTTTKPFDVGDWIEVDGQIGEVIKVTALACVVEEVIFIDNSCRFSGRILNIPNSKFLSNTITNLDFTKDYAYCDIPIVIDYTNFDPAEGVLELEKIIEEYYAPHRKEAILYYNKVKRKAGISYVDPEPRIFLSATSKDAHRTFTVRLFMPVPYIRDISSKITTDFLGIIYKICSEREKLSFLQENRIEPQLKE